jgi:hypothetical protein
MYDPRVGRPRVQIDLGSPGADGLADELARGGLFLPGEELPIASECDVLIYGPEAPVVVCARVVFADGTGVGLELQLDAELRGELVALARAAPPAEDFSQDFAGDSVSDGVPADEEDTQEEDEPPAPANEPLAKNVYERLRGLSLVDQYKVARNGELHERVALERIYGKTVWEQLLRNPRISPPEVARIARMGNLPRPQLETIVANAAWLGVPEVRRALMSNPRLTADMIPRILRHLPKHELKVAASTITYTAAVREAARRLAQG